MSTLTYQIQPGTHLSLSQPTSNQLSGGMELMGSNREPPPSFDATPSTQWATTSAIYHHDNLPSAGVEYKQLDSGDFTDYRPTPQFNGRLPAWSPVPSGDPDSGRCANENVFRIRRRIAPPGDYNSAGIPRPVDRWRPGGIPAGRVLGHVNA